VAADYRSIGLTLWRHPLSFLRDRLSKMRFIPSDVLHGFSNGQLACGCGIVTIQQKPETANGVVFITIEDEAGTVNAICWASLVEQQRREIMGSQLLGVHGIWQCEHNVRHLSSRPIFAVKVE
jgi:error-prone DNA polymerase